MYFRERVTGFLTEGTWNKKKIFLGGKKSSVLLNFKNNTQYWAVISSSCMFRTMCTFFPTCNTKELHFLFGILPALKILVYGFSQKMS